MTLVPQRAGEDHPADRAGRRPGDRADGPDLAPRVPCPVGRRGDRDGRPGGAAVRRGHHGSGVRRRRGRPSPRPTAFPSSRSGSAGPSTSSPASRRPSPTRRSSSPASRTPTPGRTGPTRACTSRTSSGPAWPRSCCWSGSPDRLAADHEPGQSVASQPRGCRRRGQDRADGYRPSSFASWSTATRCRRRCTSPRPSGSRICSPQVLATSADLARTTSTHAPTLARLMRALETVGVYRATTRDATPTPSSASSYAVTSRGRSAAGPPSWARPRTGRPGPAWWTACGPGRTPSARSTGCRSGSTAGSDPRTRSSSTGR